MPEWSACQYETKTTGSHYCIVFHQTKVLLQNMSWLAINSAWGVINILYINVLQSQSLQLLIMIPNYSPPSPWFTPFIHFVWQSRFPPKQVSITLLTRSVSCCSPAKLIPFLRYCLSQLKKIKGKRFICVLPHILHTHIYTHVMYASTLETVIYVRPAHEQRS